MKKIILAIILHSLLSPASVLASVEPAVIYWDSETGKTLRARMSVDADYWQLSPTFTVQMTQSYCAVASAVTVLNALPINKPVDPTYAPYAYFTQSNFFTPDVLKVISPQTVLAMGMTREEMAQTLTHHGVKAKSIAGDTFDDDALRTLLKRSLGDDGQFVLANYLRANLEQVGGGHWSVLAAYDELSDRVLILDVAKYKYTPAWVGISTLRLAIATIDTTSNKARGLVVVSKRTDEK
ncbi:MAG: phytochelatin synthase family protein [Gallionella sp.]